MPANPTKLPTAVTSGLQLLSPTLHHAIQHSTQEAHEGTKTHAFDFDHFTLESVLGDTAVIEPPIRMSTAYPLVNGSCALSGESSTSCYGSSSVGSIHTITTTEDLEMSRLARPYLSNSHDSEQNRPTFQVSATAAAAGFPMAKIKESTAVVRQGWLQKRKGRVLRRWKSFYCLLKSDDTLCLYASEDTVNGKLTQRYQILRVTLTDKKDSFHVIGIDDEGVPRREELRASISLEWTHWFQAFRRFFDSASMAQACERKPQLMVSNAWDQTSTSQEDSIDYERHSFVCERKQMPIANCSLSNDTNERLFASSLGLSHKAAKRCSQHDGDFFIKERRSEGIVSFSEKHAVEPEEDELEAFVPAELTWPRLSDCDAPIDELTR
ncbi:hypothetical protein CCR75_003845 [Bremia lactucae]|uniref:PH domain-containing protein n=1 Tax=Bremia lactucae TaxID=4779 RepID=A0A976IL99_BRELC|nr:hypothetical protein CCR75_003845 [Bremia lactucae]